MNNLISLDQVLGKFNKHNKDFINDLEREENLEEVETLDVIENELKGMKVNSELKKSQFISELKSGLGDKVKENPGRVIIIKKSLFQRFKDSIRSMFNKF